MLIIIILLSIIALIEFIILISMGANSHQRYISDQLDNLKNIASSINEQIPYLKRGNSDKLDSIQYSLDELVQSQENLYQTIEEISSLLDDKLDPKDLVAYFAVEEKDFNTLKLVIENRKEIPCDNLSIAINQFVPSSNNAIDASKKIESKLNSLTNISIPPKNCFSLTLNDITEEEFVQLSVSNFELKFTFCYDGLKKEMKKNMFNPNKKSIFKTYI